VRHLKKKLVNIKKKIGLLDLRCVLIEMVLYMMVSFSLWTYEVKNLMDGTIPVSDHSQY